jgi:hypothetical protein
VGNTHPGQPAGKCHREQTARSRREAGPGKGETVVQETTSDPGDRVGSANPARSKVEQRTLEGCPPECAGGPHEAAGNGGPRWMVAERDAERRPGTEPGLQTSPSASRVRSRQRPQPERQLPTTLEKVSPARRSVALPARMTIDGSSVRGRDAGQVCRRERVLHHPGRVSWVLRAPSARGSPGMPGGYAAASSKPDHDGREHQDHEGPDRHGADRGPHAVETAQRGDDDHEEQDQQPPGQEGRSGPS